MPRYIDADALREQISETYEYEFPTASGGFDEFATKIIPNIINNAITADVVPVVRCRDCKYWANGLTEERPCNKTGAYPMRSEDYCSYGEKMESEGGT